MATDPRTIVNQEEDPGLVRETGYIPTDGVNNGSNEVKSVTINYTDPAPTQAPQLQIFNDPGGRNGAIQFNNNNRLAGDSNLNWNAKHRTLSILGNLRISDSIIGKYNTNTKNLKITGGEDGYVLSTDGTGNLTWVAQTGGGTNYSNANVASYLPTYTGDLSGSNLTVTDTTNLTTLFVGAQSHLGSVSNVKITGGTGGQMIATDGQGNLHWATPQPGPQGPAGAPGLDGNAATITVGTVSTGNAGTSVLITNTGNTHAAIFNFTIPRGDHGLIGPQGDKGDTGATGATGPQGPPGANGAKGDKGDTGSQGIPGAPGAQGAPGPQGDRGATGAQGVSVTLQGTVANVIDLPPVGEPGDGYIVSASGNLYFWAPVGSQWEDIGPIVGPQGDRGPTGATGSTGATGPQGAAGNDGLDGTSFVWQGEWNGGTYNPYDVVYYLGSTYICTVVNTDTLPTDITYWEIMTDKGEQGLKGDTGDQGPRGYGVAPGGSTGQVLVKNSDDDYDTVWEDPTETTIHINDVAPSSAIEGTVWWSSEAGRSYIKYNDQWVDMSPQTAINPDLQVESITFPDGSVQTKSSDLGNLYVVNGSLILDSDSSSYINFKATGFSHGYNETKTLALGTDESYPVRIETDWLGDTKSWKFDPSGNLELPNSGKIGAIQYDNGVDVYAGPNDYYAQLNYNNQNFVYVDDTTVGVQVAESEWYFAGDGRIIFPDGTIQETAYPGETYAKVPVSDFPPSADEGTVWFNSELGRTYVKYQGQWVDASPQIVAPDPANPFDQDLNTYDNVTFNNINASNLQINDLDATTGYIGNARVEDLTVYNNLNVGNISTGNITANYFIGDGSQLSNIQFPVYDNAIIVSDTAPNANVEGRLWFNSVNARTYVTYDSQWVDSNPQTIDPTALRLDDEGLLEFPEGGVVGNAQRVHQNSNNNPGIDLYASTGMAWAQLNYNEDQYVAVDGSVVTIEVGAKTLGPDSRTWSFDINGNITFPDETVQSTAYLGPATFVDAGNAYANYNANIPLASGAANPFDQNLNTSDNVQFLNVTATNFYGTSTLANSAISVPIGNITGLGNIATLNLTGSSTNVLYGNGIFAEVTATLPNVTTDNFRINGEGKGLIVDASNLKRFGFMKYSGIEGSLVHSTATGAEVPLRIGRTTSADVTTGSVYDFTTEIYVGTNGHVRIADDNVNNINDPTDRLEVGGNIKVTEGIRFGDGSYQNTAGGGGSTGNIGFTGDAIYDINGIILENADLSHGATSALIIPSNGSTSAVQLNNLYGDIVLSSSNSGAGGLKTWRFSSGNLIFPDITTQTTAWTGTVDTANVTGLGNIATINLTGSSSTVLYGNGTFSSVPNTSWANINNINNGFGPSKIAIGENAGVAQGTMSIAVGYYAGYNTQGNTSIAIGQSAGQNRQGDNAIAIGKFAGQDDQPANSIIINGSGGTFSTTPTNSGFYVKPVRNDTGNTTNAVYYNTTTNELTYGPTSGGSSYSDSNVSTFLASFGSNTISTTGNVTAGNVVFGANAGVLAFHTGAYISGNANSITRDGSIVLQPYTGAGSTFPGVVIGGAGRLLAPSGSVHQIFNASDVTFQVPVKTPAYNSTSITTGSLIASGGIGVTGNIYVSGNTATGNNSIVAGVTGTLLANSTASFFANVNSYTQITFQNKSTGTDATADFILTADNGNDSVNYSDFGIINSGYDNSTPTNSLGNIVFAADTYLYAQGNVSNTSQAGGNLAIGTTTAGKYVKIFAGGVDNTAIIANISNVGISQPKLPAFRVYGTLSSDILAGNTISSTQGTIVDFNQGSYYNNSTGIFTAPIAGLYHAYATLRVANNNGLNQASIQKNSSSSGANIIAFWETDTNTGTATHFAMTGYAKLAVGDTLRLQVITGQVRLDSNDSWGVTFIG